MSTTTLQVKLNLTIHDAFLKPHEKEYINQLATETSAVRQGFLDAFQTWAGAELRKRMDAAGHGAFGGSGTIGARSDLEDAWLHAMRAASEPLMRRKPYEYGTRSVEHANCRCVPFYAVGRADPVLHMNISTPDAESFKRTAAQAAEGVRKALNLTPQERVSVRPTTRKEAATADHIARRVTADIKAAARKTKRAQAARKGHLTRAAKRRAKTAARKRRAR